MKTYTVKWSRMYMCTALKLDAFTKLSCCSCPESFSNQLIHDSNLTSIPNVKKCPPDIAVKSCLQGKEININNLNDSFSAYSPGSEDREVQKSIASAMDLVS